MSTEDDVRAAVAANDPHATLQALAGMDVLIPADEPKEGEEIGIPVWTAPSGHQVVPVYTSAAERKLGAPDSDGALVLDGARFITSMPDDLGLAVNPQGSFGVAFTADELAELRRGPDLRPGRVAWPTGQVILGEPTVVNSDVEAAATEAAARHVAVAALHRGLMREDREGAEAMYLIGVECRPATASAAADAAAEAVARAIGADGFVVPLNPSVEHPVVRSMLDRGAPFWRRPAG